VVELPPSRSHQRGVTRRHERGARDAVDAHRRQTSAGGADEQRRVVPIPRCWDQASRRCARRRWLESPAHRGEHAISRKPLRGECRAFRLNLSLLACAECTIFCTQGSRVRPASGIPCALSLSRVSDDARLGRNRVARTRERVRSPDERSDIRGPVPHIAPLMRATTLRRKGCLTIGSAITPARRDTPRCAPAS
jgi:hypothetical protein